MRILFLTLEFAAATFSGNGVYAQSQVRGMVSMGHNVLVVSAAPATACSANSSILEHKVSREEWCGVDVNPIVLQVPVSSWGRLDSSAPYQEFAKGIATETILQSVDAFQPDVTMVVDWSALPAWHVLKSQAKQSIQKIPMVWLNYRVFSRTETGEGFQLVNRIEGQALDEAQESIVLSRSDQQYLIQHVATEVYLASNRQPHVLLCALRDELTRIPLPQDCQETRTHNNSAGLAHSSHLDPLTSSIHQPNPDTMGAQILHSNSSTCSCSNSNSSSCHSSALHTHNLGDVSIDECKVARSRRFLTCVVRLVPEKEPERFVQLVEQLSKLGALKRLGLTPLMVAPAQDAYAMDIKARLKAAEPASVIIERFLGPSELAELFAASALNVHTASYDAFGMTIVEAASQGCPSLVHSEVGAVGATDLLLASQQEVILTDLGLDPMLLAHEVDAILQNKDMLMSVGRNAASKARSWNETANAQMLVDIAMSAIKKHSIDCVEA